MANEPASSESLPSAGELRQRMAAIRLNLRTEVDGLVDNAQDLMSWRYYLHRYPWAGVAAALAAGYMIVPRKAPPAPQLQDTLERLGRGKVVFERPPTERKPTLLQSAVSMTGAMLLRAGLAYASHRMGQITSGGDRHEPPRQEVHP